MEINETLLPIKGQVEIVIRDAKTGRIKSRDTYNNMFVTAGKGIVAQWMSGQGNAGITYCALGTGTPAPTLADTGLTTELVRKLISVRSFAANVATFQTFFGTTEGNGTLKEAGLFGDLASATPGSATLFSKIQITRTKTSSDTLTLTWTITVG